MAGVPARRLGELLTASGWLAWPGLPPPPAPRASRTASQHALGGPDPDKLDLAFSTPLNRILS